VADTKAALFWAFVGVPLAWGLEDAGKRRQDLLISVKPRGEVSCGFMPVFTHSISRKIHVSHQWLPCRSASSRRYVVNCIGANHSTCCRTGGKDFENETHG
jgi:hypothetical protein